MYEALLILLGALLGALLVLVAIFGYVSRVLKDKSAFCSLASSLFAGFGQSKRLAGLIINRPNGMPLCITFAELERAFEDASFYRLTTDPPPTDLELEH